MSIQSLCNIFGFRAKTSLGDVEVKINNRAERRKRKKNKK